MSDTGTKTKCRCLTINHNITEAHQGKKDFIRKRKHALPTHLSQEVQRSWVYPLNPKKGLIGVSGGQQRQAEVGAERVPAEQGSQALGGHGAPLLKAESKQADASGGRGADAHGQAGPSGSGGPGGGGAVGQRHLDVQSIDAIALDTQLPLVELRSVHERAAQGGAPLPVQPGVLPPSWGQRGGGGVEGWPFRVTVL